MCGKLAHLSASCFFFLGGRSQTVRHESCLQQLLNTRMPIITHFCARLVLLVSVAQAKHVTSMVSRMDFLVQQVHRPCLMPTLCSAMLRSSKEVSSTLCSIVLCLQAKHRPPYRSVSPRLLSCCISLFLRPTPPRQSSFFLH